MTITKEKYLQAHQQQQLKNVLRELNIKAMN